MASEGKENSDLKTTQSEELRCEESLGQAVEKAVHSQNSSTEEVEKVVGDSLLEIEESEAEGGALESEILDALDDREARAGKRSSGHAIDEELIANLGSGKNDYGVLEELLPQFDFDAIPLTQPKRVMAKSNPGGKGVLPEDEGNTAAPPSRSLKRKKKPASLLDSYFKGL